MLEVLDYLEELRVLIVNGKIQGYRLIVNIPDNFDCSPRLILEKKTAKECLEECAKICKKLGVIEDNES